MKVEEAAKERLADWFNAMRTVGLEPSQSAHMIRIALSELIPGGDTMIAAMMAEVNEQFPPQLITVATTGGQVYRLTGLSGYHVEAGMYAAVDGDRFFIEVNPQIITDDDTQEPAKVMIHWLTVKGAPVDTEKFRVPGWVDLDDLVANWKWERVN